jgi:hypothetical protein
MKPSPPIEELCGGDVVYRVTPRQVVLLAMPEYNALIRVFGGKQNRRGGRWIIARAQGELLIEQLRRFVPLR